MAEIPESTNSTAAAVDDLYEGRQNCFRSNGVSISTVGGKCERKLWYSFRWASAIIRKTGRMSRLLNTGEREETRLIDDLRSCGFDVLDRDPDRKDRDGNPKQFRVDHMGGHISGRLDGVIGGIPEAPRTWHLLEIKTFARKYFVPLVKNGVEATKPEHFAQCQLGMGLASPRLERALYLAKCKDDDAIYQERIPFDFQRFAELIAKGARVVNAQDPPRKISENADKFPCGWCDHRAVCHLAEKPRFNCRTCLHSTPVEENGTWHCAKHEKTLSSEEQALGCPKHLFIPSLFPQWTVFDADDDRVCYRDMKGSEHFNHAGGEVSEVPF